ncbi:DUF5103 domain-containing protein [Sphingobacterium alkalisoli]|uniref:DUF5103 domain-containing protein n=1 Tax=Sphingobacterium alkalisoli TaxID=1874115 RepID=A0A4V5LY85_9SPHI|nr:DUF5103 domain-containing protein [Sphingobacterium alkalisoli]TJY63849.1 DUF5103 domain-containing protein [Sphingobacterium alkalisoli]GGH24468.1 hypothetical protein GCM10011418_32400 [Sphingobacterium alkalisoli]
MNKAFILLTLLYFTLSKTEAQRKKKTRENFEQSPPQELIYDNKSYLEAINTVQLFPTGKEGQFPIYTLGSQEQLLLSFDDLRADVRSYYYSIEHCNANWEPSRVSPLDYAEGYNEDRLDNFFPSQGTFQAYTHYKVAFPNEYIKPKIAGNYLLKVYEDADKTRLVVTRRFYVVRPLIQVGTHILPSVEVSKRMTNQKIDVSLKTPSLTIPNPERDLQVHVFQNQREDNKMVLTKPMFIGNNEIKYNNSETLDFLGNNEFRFVDLRSFRLGSNRVQQIQNDSLVSINVLTDEDLRDASYADTYDENGKFYIRNLDFENAEIQSDYADVHFSLQTNQKITGNLHLVGGFNNFQRNEQNRLTYNPTSKNWELTLKLKQGLYDYEYVLETPEGQIITNAFTNSFYATGNDYLVLVYNRRIGTYWDELLGVGTISIHNKTNKN